MYLTNLGVSQRLRFARLSELADLEDAIFNNRKAVEFTADEHPHKAMYLSNLGISQQLRFECIGGLADLDDSISNTKKAIELTDDEHPNKSLYFSNLGNSQHSRFEHLSQLADLEESISNFQKAIQLTNYEHPHNAVYLSNLGDSHRTRFKHLGELFDLSASVSAFQAAAETKTTYPYRALVAARKWAEIAHQNGDLTSALKGYRTALEILPKVAWLGLEVPSRQEWLLQERSENLGCLSATCSIQLGLHEEAVELLDLGRSVFWQQASSLRGDLEILREEEPELAQTLGSICQKLDAGSFSFPILGERDAAADDSYIEEIRRERRDLVTAWEALVDRIRQLPNFQYFLRPIPFRQLCQAAAGKVIIINVSQYGVDALIFDATHPIQHVPLPDVDFETIAELSSNLLAKRPMNGTAQRRQRYINSYFKPALRTVWDNIIVPIFTQVQIPLDHIGTFPRCRIWWYPTGPLTFIPLHAAGPGEVLMSAVWLFPPT
jgi:tetratricopeptide (TPR) repeat protein